jgi:flagellar biosynthesis/type III secretory pathway M-ring protein FliF/YscJ
MSTKYSTIFIIAFFIVSIIIDTINCSRRRKELEAQKLRIEQTIEALPSGLTMAEEQFRENRNTWTRQKREEKQKALNKMTQQIHSMQEKLETVEEQIAALPESSSSESE